MSAHKDQGMAVIVVIALFAIMMIFLGTGLRSLNYLRQDLKIIERKQLQRIRQASAVTNGESVTNHVVPVELGNSFILFNRP